MTDHQFNILSIGAVTLALIWLFKERGVDTVSVPPAQSPALPVGFQLPMDSAYGDNSNATPFSPVTAPQLAINIGNQSAALLDQNYIPLFGFVGMAQGALYQ
jgi:hypothetical protein